MPGIPYGCRVLMNLALAAELRGGASAPSRLVVILHLNERQVEQVTADYPPLQDCRCAFEITFYVIFVQTTQLLRAFVAHPISSYQSHMRRLCNSSHP